MGNKALQRVFDILAYRIPFFSTGFLLKAIFYIPTKFITSCIINLLFEKLRDHKYFFLPGEVLFER